MTQLKTSKAKFAVRVIEIFEFFNSGLRPSTVLDIARHNRRPQSSTSELLARLTDEGLLYKDPVTREYAPTPRMATMGIASQPESIRNGRLVTYIDQLSRTTRKPVALLGTVGTHVQIFHCTSEREYGHDLGVSGIITGREELLTTSAAGQLLLTTLDPAQLQGRLWRLNSEAPTSAKFEIAEMRERIECARDMGHVSGPSGFVHNMQMSAVLLQREALEPALAVGIFYPEALSQDADAYVSTLKHGISQILRPVDAAEGTINKPFLRAV